MLKPDIPFERDDAHYFMPWMVALMIGLAALMLCCAITLGNWVNTTEGTYTESFTIYIPYHEGTMEASTERIENTLAEYAMVTSHTILSEKEVINIIEPWLGISAGMEELPLPVVIDVQIKPAEEISTENITILYDALRATGEGIEIETQKGWVEKFAQFSYVVQVLVVLLSVFIFLSLAIMMMFISRATMKLHARTILLLHAIGAEDSYISRQFQYNASLLVLRGAIPGTIAAGMLYFLLDKYITNLNAPLLPSLSLSVQHAVVLFFLPIVCSALALIAARHASLNQLRVLP